MRIKNFTFLIVLLVVGFVFQQCSDDDTKPQTGKVSGKVTDASSSTALADVTIILFDASTNAPAGTTKTNSTGDYSFDVTIGDYFLKFYKQGYESIPTRGLDAVPFEVTAGATTSQPAEMFQSSVANAGYISGKVLLSDASKGVLVVAEGNGEAYSTVSDKEGNYTIFNVPAGSFNVRGYLAQFSSAAVAASVTANTETSGVNISMVKGVSGSVTGTFKVISQTNIQVQPTTMDITLIHPVTRESIPGLSVRLPYSSSISYSIPDVPDGTYIVRATFVNDYIVVDPDYIVKFGEPETTVSAATATVNIVATSAVSLTSNTNEMSTSEPVVVGSTSLPAFTWSAYPSTSDYVIEVLDAATGQVIWGGFSEDANGNPVKNIVIASNTTSIAFNSDGNASASLQSGRLYRWRIYASKNDQNSATGWTLIAMSEDQQGLFRID